MKKIAIPITKHNKIEEHFRHCECYEIYTFSNANEILDLQLLESEQGCGCKTNLVNLLATGGVTFMLSGRIGTKAINKLNNAGIDVIHGCSGDSSDVILQFIEGKISDNDLGCLQQDQNHKKGHGHVCNH